MSELKTEKQYQTRAEIAKATAKAVRELYYEDAIFVRDFARGLLERKGGYRTIKRK